MNPWACFALYAHLLYLYTVLLVVATHEHEKDAILSAPNGNVNYEGCNFTPYAERGMLPFSYFRPNSTVCAIPVKFDPQRFYYICPGMSYPWSCPEEVIHKGQKVSLDTLVDQVAVRKMPHSIRHDVDVFTGIVGKSREVFNAFCTCELPNGQKMIMKFYSAGFATWSLWTLVILPAVAIARYLKCQ